MTARLLLALAAALASPACNSIHGDEPTARCMCLGPRGRLEFGFIPNGQCVTPLGAADTPPDALLVRTCVQSSLTAATRPYDLTGATIKSSNPKLLNAGYDQSCGTNCISLRWFNVGGSGDVIVSRDGAEVDRVTLTVSK